MEQPSAPAKGQERPTPRGMRLLQIALLALAAWSWGWGWVAPYAPELAATMKLVAQSGIVPYPHGEAVEAIPVWGAAVLPGLAWLPWLLGLAWLAEVLPRWGRETAAGMALLLCGLWGADGSGWWSGLIAAGAIFIPVPFRGFGDRRGALAGLGVGLVLLAALPQGSTALWGRDVLLGLPGGSALVEGYYRVSPLSSRPFEPLVDHGQPVGAWIDPTPMPLGLSALLRGIGVATVADRSGMVGDFTIAPAPGKEQGWILGNRSGKPVRLEVPTLGRDAWIHALQSLSMQSDDLGAVRHLMGWGLMLGWGALLLAGLTWIGGRTVAAWGARPAAMAGSGVLAFGLIALGTAPAPEGDVWKSLHDSSGAGGQRIALARVLAAEVADGRALTEQQWHDWLHDEAAAVRLWGAKAAGDSHNRALGAQLVSLMTPGDEPALIVSCKAADSLIKLPGEAGAGVLDTLVRAPIFPWYLQGYAYRALRQQGWTP